MQFPDRQKAANFLRGLEKHLNQKVPSPSRIRDWIASKKSAAKPGTDVGYENLFVEEFILTSIPEYLVREAQLTPEEAFTAFLAEADSAKKKKLASGSPASSNKHLFKKVFGIALRSVVDLWWDRSQKFPMAQSCPDWAFRAPCPHTVVFEAKLYRQGEIDHAKTELVKAIYQCMFYRGQPRVPEIRKHTSWDYEFACLMAYDASEGQSLVEAWDKVRDEVKDGCWNSSNIFVMVLPSTQSSP